MAHELFSYWTLGDAFACGNDWKNAVSCYTTAIERNIPWLGSTTHRPRLTAALRGFDSQLHTFAGRDLRHAVNRSRAFFAVGARCLLGFEEVTFLQFDVTLKQWNVVPLSLEETETSTPKSPFLKAIPFLPAAMSGEPSHRLQALLKRPEQLKVGINEIGGAADSAYAMVALLPPADGRPHECIIVSCLRSQAPLTRDRRSKAEDALQVLEDAYQQACRNERTLWKADFQRRLLEAIPDVMRVIGGPPDRTRQALKKAGEALRDSGYFRVMFSLVEHGNRIIKGEIDCKPDGEPDIATPTNFTLELSYDSQQRPMYEDVQQQCVIEGRTLGINDARTHPLTNLAVVASAGQLSTVLIPLMVGRVVFGTTVDPIV